MTFFGQSLAAARIGLAGLPQRLWSSLVIVISMACVVGVSLSMLAVTAGMLRTYQTGGDAGRAIVPSAHAPDEYGCDLPRSAVGTILDAPGIARGSAGHAIADAEPIVYVAPPPATLARHSFLRGVGPAGLDLRPGFRITSGRLFRSGRQEVVVGAGVQRRLGVKVGDTIIMPDGEWPVVGAFSTGGLVDSQLIADAETVISTTRTSCFGSILVKLESPRAMDELKRWLTTNPALAVTAERQSEYYYRTAVSDSDCFTTIAYLVGRVMASGALFGSVKMLYASVDARRQEIATLRALGFAALPVALSVMLEAVLLSLAGALAGVTSAWLVFDGRHSSSGMFDLSVSAELAAVGIGWALLLALLGGLPPAFRAARLSPADALRAM